ncbi:class A beta-lactamase [Virgibacillus halophilus]|uniref:class A beta-lactamase n=1 Tax=Tigheibacillus halophilus TaxID=361280 RepID=UPI0036F309E6
MKLIRICRLKKMIPLLLLSCLMLAGWTEDNTSTSSAQQKQKKDGFAKLEEKFDARLGVFALDTGSGKTVSYRPEERFPYASTHKVFTVGALLQQNTVEDLNKRIFYTQKDLVNYNPVTEKHVETGMTLKELCDASLRYSDNTADNLLLKELGGPEALKKSLRKIGDHVTDPERFEPELNDVKPGEIHDTSTPKAMAASLQAFTLGDALAKEKRLLLNDWLERNTTGDTLIRAGVPKDWKVADKSGTASFGTRNDIAIVWPPKEKPIVIAIFSSHDKKDAKTNDKLIEQATKEVMNKMK